MIGGAFAIVIVKMMFGGLGQNFMNPALGARCFLLIAFAADMTNFTVGAYSGATPLAQMRNCLLYTSGVERKIYDLKSQCLDLIIDFSLYTV